MIVRLRAIQLEWFYRSRHSGTYGFVRQIYVLTTGQITRKHALAHGSKLTRMRKRLVTPTAERRSRGQGWLDLERAAVVEVTSEDKDFPVESAFASEDARGWRAEAPGRQTIRLIFDHPQRLRCVSLVFEEEVR